MNISEDEAKVIQLLLDLVFSADCLADNTCEDDDGLNVWRPDFEDMCDCLNEIDDLPDEAPGIVMGPAAKARWALRRLIP